AKDIDLLLLDEPENHLDIDSKTLLAQAIQKFKGAIILVSHNDFFVQQCGISETFILHES
ncbi:ABC transporter ATP-binding protein, partial [Acinetobacter faecalis]|nr:ABC transporter ATP-binding protein [Acinetobacter faecalis]